MDATYIPTAERRKQVKLRLRADLVVTDQRYEGKLCRVVKDPVSLKYYRFSDREFFVFDRLNGRNTLEDIRKEFEKHFAPDRLELDEAEGFARQLVTAGLVQHESPNAARALFEKRGKQRRLKRVAAVTNILYIKVPVFDPDRLLDRMLPYFRWVFTKGFLWCSVLLMLSAALLVLFKYDVFYAKLPAYQEFFAFKTLLYMWISLGIVKVIHEFGHGLSCKAFGGESHEMGALFMCFSPALYCNVTDSWTVADKWKRIIISFAGIWVELVIAAIATWVWWYTPHWPFVNNVAMCLMVLCSVSTFVFNANPLMRFDGYYILADWIEVPNLRERANKYLSGLFQKIALGIDVPPEGYMAPGRRMLFVVYAVASYIYRWFVTVSILLFLAGWLKPYKLEILSLMLALGALGTMLFWPAFKMVKNIRQRGRLPDMKRPRVLVTTAVFAALVAAFFFVPTPYSRVREAGLVQVSEGHRVQVFVTESGELTDQFAFDGATVVRDGPLARFSSPTLLFDRLKADEEVTAAEARLTNVRGRLRPEPSDKFILDQLRQERQSAMSALAEAKANRDVLTRRAEEVEILRAPKAGRVMGAPRREDRGRPFQKGEPTPFCLIADPDKVRVLVPVSAADFQEIRRNLEMAKGPGGRGHLEVTLLPKNQSDRPLTGKVLKLPDTDEKNVPVALTNRGGGPLATKPGTDPNVHQPLVQTFLVPVEVIDADASIVPGTLATAKIHLEWRSMAWITWRAIASALDVGLW